MAHKIKNNPDIKGVRLNDTIALISQFADDVTLFLSFDKLTLEAVADTLHVIETNTGLKVNYEKTCLYRIGSLANTDAEVYMKQEFTWTNDPIASLGVILSNYSKEMNNLNYEQILAKSYECIKLLDT